MMIFARTLLIVFLCGQLMMGGCIHAPTIHKPEYAPFLNRQPISEETLEKIRHDSPKNAVFADLLQAFALMRTANLADIKVQHNIFDLLASSVNSFEDLTDPVNFSKAFSADEDKAFRGRPHERMFASLMAGVFLMAENRCGEALPYLRNAEFLDARFQKMPFGTDAPLVYSLMYRCLVQQKAAPEDIERARQGVFYSIRFLSLHEPFIETLVESILLDLRPMALSNRMAAMIFEISLNHSLLNAKTGLNIEALIDDAAMHAEIFIATLTSHFDDNYQERMKILIEEQAKVLGLSKKEGKKYVEDLVFERIGLEAKNLASKMKMVIKHDAQLAHKIKESSNRAHELTERVLKAAASDKMIVSFSGMGPSLVREGSYEEISVIKPGTHANLTHTIREKKQNLSLACGFHRTNDGGFSVTLCKSGSMSEAGVELLPTVELLSLTRKATMIQGRQFDKVLKGRAQFRAATENVAEIGAWSAFFLFYLGSAMINDCQRSGASEACYTKAYVVWALAGITAIFSGTIWLIGRTSNPAADSRFIHLMYESGWLAL